LGLLGVVSFWGRVDCQMFGGRWEVEVVEQWREILWYAVWEVRVVYYKI
jgi:hypothetical protein